ncbi:signal peptidase I [Phocaeicola sartorii]|nr:signal peptidase I [Phocaeicola sartorii]
MWATVLSFSGIIKLLLGEWATVPTSSMVPTILPGDLIWYEKYSYGAVMPTRISELPVLNLLCLIPAVWEKDKIRNWGYHRTPGFNKPARMDIIVFRNPLDRNQLLTKRIIGLPGDTLTIRRDKIYINGKVIKDIARKK